MKKYRWGILGTGRIARSFAQALNGCEDAVCYGVASRSLEKAQRFAGEFGFEKSCGSYGELAADKDIDAVYIATPMASHCGDALLCIEKGRNVLCEKSIALNSREYEKMLGAAQKKGVFFMEAMWMKCRPTYLKALEWIREGRIGRVTSVRADFSNHVPYDPGDRLFAPECGGGALLDLGVYPLTLVSDVLGQEPEDIRSTVKLYRGIDMSERLTLTYPGAEAFIRTGFDEQLENDALITGEKGSIRFGRYFFCSSELSLYDEAGRELERSEIPVRVNGYEYEIEEVHRCLSRGLRESSLIPWSSTGAVMRMMDKCRADWGLTYPGEQEGG